MGQQGEDMLQYAVFKLKTWHGQRNESLNTGYSGASKAQNVFDTRAFLVVLTHLLASVTTIRVS
jgi:hypothetical protein